MLPLMKQLENHHVKEQAAQCQSEVVFAYHHEVADSAEGFPHEIQYILKLNWVAFLLEHQTSCSWPLCFHVSYRSMTHTAEIPKASNGLQPSRAPMHYDLEMLLKV